MFHELQATPSTVHWGYFDAGLKPALRIKSGDIIRAEAVTHQAGDAPELMMDDAVRLLYSSIPEDDRNPGVHLMTGPIYVEDAQPGDMLEVRYLQMRPRFRYGSNLAAHWGLLYKEMGEKERVTIYKLDPDYNTARARKNHQTRNLQLRTRIERCARTRTPASGHGRCCPRCHGPCQHCPARRARWQYRQLANRRWSDNVLPGGRARRVVLDW